VIVAEKALPAVCAPGEASANELAVVGFTAKPAVLPETELCVALSVVLSSASYNVIGDAVPTPAVNVTEDG
jgi:hypothetical protein